MGYNYGYPIIMPLITTHEHPSSVTLWVVSGLRQGDKVLELGRASLSRFRGQVFRPPARN